jgi:hypothetical protein
LGLVFPSCREAGQPGQGKEAGKPGKKNILSSAHPWAPSFGWICAPSTTSTIRIGRAKEFTSACQEAFPEKRKLWDNVYRICRCENHSGGIPSRIIYLLPLAEALLVFGVGNVVVALTALPQAFLPDLPKMRAVSIR